MYDTLLVNKLVICTIHFIKIYIYKFKLSYFLTSFCSLFFIVRVSFSSSDSNKFRLNSSPGSEFRIMSNVNLVISLEG